MSEDISLNLFKAQQSISIESAKQISITTNTIPLMPSLSPRWLLRLLEWVDVPTGIFKINKISYTSDIQHIDLSNKNVDIESLKLIPLFELFPDNLISKLLEKSHTKEIDAGQVIIKEGDIEDGLYIILGGELDVTIKGQDDLPVVIKKLSAGDYFGERSLVESISRPTTVSAHTSVILLHLSKQIFSKVVKNQEIQNKIAQYYKSSKKTAAVTGYEEVQAPLIAGHHGEPPLPHGFASYTEHPKEIHLSVIQTIIGIHTRIGEIYNVPYNQLEQQLRVTIENIREREEWEIINNHEFGLLNNVDPYMVIRTRQGAPTPDDLDALLSLAWKNPSFFLAHPKAIAAFGRECTFRGVPPPTIEMFGTSFLTWRGIPLIPSNKIMLNNNGKHTKTDILLMRVGEEAQGVIGLHKVNASEHKIPSLTVKFMGINERSIASYLITKYFSTAVLVPDALAVLKNVEIDKYHDYEK